MESHLQLDKDEERVAPDHQKEIQVGSDQAYELAETLLKENRINLVIRISHDWKRRYNLSELFSDFPPRESYYDTPVSSWSLQQLLHRRNP